MSDETPEVWTGKEDFKKPHREQWLWVGLWEAGREYSTGTPSTGIPVARDRDHVYACKYKHFSTEYDRPSGGCSFWEHIPEFCCPLAGEVRLTGM